VEAIKWWHKSAEQGHVDAQCNIGWCYWNGVGILKDQSEAGQFKEREVQAVLRRNFPMGRE
jgi:TPR repeat protein